MEYTEAVGYLEAHIGLGGPAGLDRMRILLEEMGHPEQGYPIIHVAGTNGKTSTSRFASLILAAHGLTTGTYTSPHLQSVEERIAVNGRMASPDEFALAVSDVRAFVDIQEARTGAAFTYFELATASAFAFLADQAVNAAVLEVGLGGRLDATNVVDAEVCVITSIGLDHTELLGTDLATIAGEKVAIADPGSILISGSLPGPALEVVSERARALGIQHRKAGSDFAVESSYRGVHGWLATIAGAEATYEDVFLPVHGRHQLGNLAIAIASCEALLGDRLDPEAVRGAAAAATAPGRMEPLAAAPFLMVDGAHNVDGIEALVEALMEEFPTTGWQLVFAAMGDKKVAPMVELLSPVVEGWVATEVDSPRAIPASELAEMISATVHTEVLVGETVEQALDMARAEAGPGGSVLVTGSLYLVGRARDLILG